MAPESKDKKAKQDKPKDPTSVNIETDEKTEKTRVMQNQETLNRELQKAKEQDPCFIMIRGPQQGHRYSVNWPEMVVGRDPGVEISIDDASVSRKHARVTRQYGEVYITDLGTTNGTVINGKKIPPSKEFRLAKEDMVRIGSTILKFLPAGELEILMYGNLETAAHMDPLTMVYNKRYLEEAIEAEFKRAKALQNDLSVLFFDIDHFKKVNDTYGHEAGDCVLKEFAKIIRTRCLRPKDVFARFGGEEFVVLLLNTPLQTATEIAETVRATIEAHSFVYEKKRIPVTTSVGVAELNSSIETSHQLVKVADKALYAAKADGRNCVRVGS